MFEDAVNACATWALAQAGAEIGEVAGSSRGDDFDVAFFGVADPAGETEFASFAVDKPAKANALNATLHEKMENHGV